MIEFDKVKPGDKLVITGAGAPGFAKLGETVEVVSTDGVRRVDVKRGDGETAYFALTCGAARLDYAASALLAQDQPQREKESV